MFRSLFLKTVASITLVYLCLIIQGRCADPAELKNWKVDGDVSMDSTRSHSGKGASIKIAPGGKATRILRSDAGSGRVTLWIYDDKTVADDPKAGRVGPCWGVIQPDGKALVAGVLYAPYISGDEGYTAGDGEGLFYHTAQWLSTPRKEEWSKWDFVFNSDKGVTLLINDKPVKFDWNRTNIDGFSGIVIFGDEAKGTKRQTVWVDDVTDELGGPMNIKPTPPPPPPPFLPEKDPAADGAPVKFEEAVAGKHPRLLLTADRIAKLREFYKNDKAAVYRGQMEGYLPLCVIPENRKTSEAWGQEVGLFEMPMLALHYVITGDKQELARCVEYLKWLAGTANWTLGGEPAVADTPEAYTAVLEKMKHMPPAGENNSDTTASFTMVGASLMWDWLYNDLDPAFREQFRQVLWQHARVMYYGGHLGGNPGGGYWRGVPMYNHRWFRDWGMTLAAVASSDAIPDDQWFLGKVRDELQFMADWLPEDGSIHEGPGYGASAGALGITFKVFDQCFGTHHLERPFFRNVSMFSMQESAPGMQDSIHFADTFTKCLSIHPFYLETASHFHEANLLDGIRNYVKAASEKFGVRDYAWLSLIADDPSMAAGDYTKLPTTIMFSDLGLAIMRDSWKDDAVAAMFKCGPPGGYTLNAWRPTAKTSDGKLPYINVAHDHPDANSFVLMGNGDYTAETDRYPEKPGKLSSSNNTILINGLGQTPEGRPEGDAWLQPSSNDMTKMGVITAWKDAGKVVVTEGEASGSYLAYTDRKTKISRPALDRFRRTFIWVKGGYVLVLDDIRSPQPVDVTWLMQGANLAAIDEAKGLYHLSKNKSGCDFQVLADTPFASKMGVSTANDHGKLLDWQQLQATANVQAIRFVSIYDPWHHGDLKLAFTPAGAEKATITVEGKGINDKWEWQSATGKFEAATLHGKRKHGFDIIVDAKTAAPPVPDVTGGK